ncbi:hypothetical protein [Bauldia sp.]|uniref:hypothetical protein n=1 Tax=Bauldia sp. TaxID=2575872 RepID=UPI0025BD736E|nr:hypothetical protein [Bauldia sp.]
MATIEIRSTDDRRRLGSRDPSTSSGRARASLAPLHAAAGTAALLLIASFWTATLVTELFGPWTAVVTVKQLIPWGFLILVPALAATGGSGFALAKGRSGGLIGTKRKRMIAIAANGLLVLVPSAFFLAARAGAGLFDTAFYVVQAVELVAGAINVTLLGLNMRDGFAMTRRRRKSRRRGAI